MNTSETLYRAADLIEERGWSQGTGWFPKADETAPVCAEGAIKLALVGDVNEYDRNAHAALAAYLHDRYPECINSRTGTVIPFGWNDRPERTAAEVIEVLRAAAVIEAARESENAAYCA